MEEGIPGAIGAAWRGGPLDSAQVGSIVLAAGEAAYEWNIVTDELRWSENAARLFGVGAPEKIASGREFAAILDPNNLENRYDTILGSSERDAGNGVSYSLSYGVVRAGEDTPLWIEDSGRWYAGLSGKPERATGVVRVVTERYLREQQLLRASAFDNLTGGLNRSRLCRAIEDALVLAARCRTSFGVLVIGIDDLSRLNRAYGFDQADHLIGLVAQRLRSRMRAGDSLGRFSANKFGIILQDCDADDLVVAAARFVTSVRETPIDTANGAVPVSVTAGGVLAPRHARTLNEVIEYAEEALDLAKAAGRGSFRAYVPTVEGEARRRENYRVTELIVSALNERRVDLAFQPVVHAGTRETVFRECLVRLADAAGAEVDALAILAAAEKLDLVRMIDHRMLELVSSELRDDPTARLSLNVSASTVHDPVWLAALGAEMRNGLGERLIVEITESAAIRDVEATRRFVARTKAHGCKVAIDDFGAGYSSFRNLRRLGVDMVKIDGSFVSHLENSADDRAFVRALLELARELGLETVAEWVQSESGAAMLLDWGCDYLQGALVGLANLRPAPQLIKSELTLTG